MDAFLRFCADGGPVRLALIVVAICAVLLTGCNPESPSDRAEERCGPIPQNCWTVCQPQDARADGQIVMRRVC